MGGVGLQVGAEGISGRAVEVVVLPDQPLQLHTGQERMGTITWQQRCGVHVPSQHNSRLKKCVDHKQCSINTNNVYLHTDFTFN